MADNSGALSQDAIDALLGGNRAPARKGTPARSGKDSSNKGARTSATASTARAARAAPPVRPAAPSNTPERDIPRGERLTSNADAAAARRIAALEATLKKMAALEEKLEALNSRLRRIEQAAQNSPVFNLYSKFSCSSCGTHGAAQVRARCGSCGKEGWFGRKTPA